MWRYVIMCYHPPIHTLADFSQKIKPQRRSFCQCRAAGLRTPFPVSIYKRWCAEISFSRLWSDLHHPICHTSGPDGADSTFHSNKPHTHTHIHTHTHTNTVYNSIYLLWCPSPSTFYDVLVHHMSGVWGGWQVVHIWVRLPTPLYSTVWHFWHLMTWLWALQCVKQSVYT
jgi:hypothetical protein